MSAKVTARSAARSGGRSVSKGGTAPLGSAAPLRSKAHLQLVTDHGRLVNPGFVAGEAVWVTARVVRDEAGQQAGGPAEPRVRRDGGTVRGPAALPRHRAEAVGRPGDAGPRGVRLTRRGRLAITSAIVMLIAALTIVLASAA